MKELASRASMSERNKRFIELIKKDPSLIDEVADARVCNEIAVDLYDLRTKANITQKELAKKLGVQQSNISRWEQAGYQGYKVKMLAKLVRTLGGKLTVNIAQDQPTVLRYFAYQKSVHNITETFHPNGVMVAEESIINQSLFALEMKGEGAKNANAPATV